MTEATIHPEFNPGRSPLLALAAVFATALTIGVAVLLPGQPAIPEGVTAIAAAQPAIDAIRPVAAQVEEVQAMTQLVTLPPWKSWEYGRPRLPPFAGAFPAVFKKS